MVTVFIHKIHGNSGRPGSPDYSSAIPWTWVEIENALPLFSGGSLFFTTLFFLFLITDIYYFLKENIKKSSVKNCLLYTSPSPRDRTRSRMPSSA